MTAALDYPAAHSMDTTWFAVDADGCVAEFNSSEEGGVPDQAASGGGASSPSFDVFYLDAVRATRRLVATCQTPESRAVEADDEPGFEAPPMPRRQFDRPARALLLIAPGAGGEAAGGYREAPQAEVERALPESDVLVLHERAPRVLLVSRPLAPAKLEELRAHRDVSALWTDAEGIDPYDEPDGEDGVFYFRHDESAEGGGAGAYRRRAATKTPLRLDEVPAPIRDHVARLRLPVRFEETESLHLADLLPEGRVMTWNDTPLRDTPEARKARDERERAARLQRAVEARKQARVAGVAFLLLLALAALLHFLRRR